MDGSPPRLVLSCRSPALLPRHFSICADVFAHHEGAQRAAHFYGYRVERQYNLSNQKLGAWLWDELKGWLLGLAFGTLFVELIYAIIRIAPSAGG